MKRNVAISIAAKDAGCTVLDFLGRRFTYYDRGQWLNQIGRERIFLNGRPVLPETLLAAGDTLAYIGFNAAEPPVATTYRVLFEDRTLLAVAKPANLPCHPGGRYFKHTLWQLLKTGHKLKDVFFVNRIDRETSGVVLIAKTPGAARDLQGQFNAKTVQKRYLAGVEGEFPAGAVVAEGVLCRDPSSPVRKKQRFFPAAERDLASDDALRCRTGFRLIRAHRGMSLVAAEPFSGRLHQIRATLWSLGYPVVGDKLYGVDDTIFLRFIADRLSENDRRRLRLPRQALHAASLRLRHPASGEKMHFLAPLPEDMAALLGGPESA